MTETDLEEELKDRAHEAQDAPPEAPSESLDDDNRLKAEFVRSVKDALDDEDFERVYDLVEPLHPPTSPTCSSWSTRTSVSVWPAPSAT